MTAPDLLPCPFCGGKPKHTPKSYGFSESVCCACGCDYDGTPEEWNRRAALPPAKQEHVAISNARGVGVKPLVWQPTYDGAGNLNRVTVAYCPVFEKRFYAERPEDQPRIDAKRAARILAALEPAPAAAQAREAAIREAALRDAADYIEHAPVGTRFQDRDAILALIGEKPREQRE